MKNLAFRAEVGWEPWPSDNDPDRSLHPGAAAIRFIVDEATTYTLRYWIPDGPAWVRRWPADAQGDTFAVPAIQVSGGAGKEAEIWVTVPQLNDHDELLGHARLSPDAGISWDQNLPPGTLGVAAGALASMVEASLRHGAPPAGPRSGDVLRLEGPRLAPDVLGYPQRSWHAAADGARLLALSTPPILDEAQERIRAHTACLYDPAAPLSPLGTAVWTDHGARLWLGGRHPVLDEPSPGRDLSAVERLLLTHLEEETVDPVFGAPQET